MADRAAKTASRYTACRRSAFTPLVGFKWEKSKAGLNAVTDKVRARWLWNADRLLKAGWLAGVSARGKVFKCAPVGTVEKGTGYMSCDRPTVCPFCFARHYILDPFIRIEQRLYGEAWHDLKAKRLADTHSVVIGFRFGIEADTVGTDLIGATRRTLNYMRLFQKQAKQVFGSTLGTTLIQVWPKDRAVEGCISGVHLVECESASEVVVYPTLDKLKRKVEAKGFFCDKLVLVRNPTKKALASVFGKAILLPKAYYERPPEECAAVLNAIANTRLFFRLTGRRKS